MKVEELTGGLLHYWTARAQGLQVQLHAAAEILICRLHGPLGGRIYRPEGDEAACRLIVAGVYGPQVPDARPVQETPTVLLASIFSRQR
jgi:hypothetical protein